MNLSYAEGFKDPVPTRFNPKHCSEHLKLSENDLVVSYSGPGEDDTQAGTVRTDEPIPQGLGVYYFEITIVSKGEDGYMGVGLEQQDTSLSRLPGWEDGSYGYHGDDGNTFCESGRGEPYGPEFGSGDVIGCLYNELRRQVIYTKNGMQLGVAFNNIKHGLYPCVGLRTKREVMRGNFGASSFVFNIEQYVKDEIGAARRKILNCEVAMERYVQNYIVLQFLTHSGHQKTAASFAKSILGRDVAEIVSFGSEDLKGLSQSSQVSGDSKTKESTILDQMRSVEMRKETMSLISRGKINESKEVIEGRYPGLLSSERCKNTVFHLGCLDFAKIVQDGNLGLAVQYARDHLAKFSATHETTLKEVCALLAYSDPEESPVKRWVGEKRTEVSKEVNSVLLEADNHKPESVIELLAKQSAAVLDIFEKKHNSVILERLSVLNK